MNASFGDSQNLTDLLGKVSATELKAALDGLEKFPQTDLTEPQKLGEKHPLFSINNC